MKGRLMLTDDQGTILETWHWSEDHDSEDSEIDFLVPLQKYGPADLAAQINMAVRRVGGAGERE